MTLLYALIALSKRLMPTVGFAVCASGLSAQTLNANPSITTDLNAAPYLGRESGICFDGEDRAIAPEDFEKERGFFYTIPRTAAFAMRKEEVSLQGTKAFGKLALQEILMVEITTDSTAKPQTAFVVRIADGGNTFLALLPEVLNADHAGGKRLVLKGDWPMKASPDTKPELMGCTFKFIQ